VIRNRSIVAVAAALVAGQLFVSPASPTGAPCLTEQPTKIGNAGNNTINGTNGRDVIFGRGGNDTIRGRGGQDVLCGEGGHDVLLGGEGADHASGDAGNDQVYGNDGSDVLEGGSGNDNVYGGRGADSSFDGNGRDNLYLGRGNDTGGVADKTGGDFINGGPDEDQCDLDAKDAEQNCEVH
jgi:Ca2+-binding RTX toxin-like protein